MTGRLAASAAAVHTLSTRQFSDSCGSGFGRANSVASCFCIAEGGVGAVVLTKGEAPNGTCGQLSPCCAASRTPLPAPRLVLIPGAGVVEVARELPIRETAATIPALASPKAACLLFIICQP